MSLKCLPSSVTMPLLLLSPPQILFTSTMCTPFSERTLSDVPIAAYRGGGGGGEGIAAYRGGGGVRAVV